MSDSSGDQTVVPVVLRSLVKVDGHGGSFDGTLLGGNGRQFVAQTDTFEFNVPKDRKALSVALAWPDNQNTEAIGWLIAPDGTLLGSNVLRVRGPEHGRQHAHARARGVRTRRRGPGSGGSSSP